MDTLIFSYYVRYYTISIIEKMGFGHLGSSLSITDILSVLYNETMNIKPDDPHWDLRDYFILSKGHGGPGLYATLALKGFFPKGQLFTVNEPNTKMPSHPDQRTVPGVDATTGSLGMGLSIAVGIALGLRILNKKQYVYSIVGDGELQEGQCWEAIQNASHEKISNLIIFIDNNMYQVDGQINNICASLLLREKFSSFGWNTLEINGHDINEISIALEQAKKCDNKPTAIISHTIKGRGMNSFERGIVPHNLSSLTDIILSDIKTEKKNLETLIMEAGYEL